MAYRNKSTYGCRRRPSDFHRLGPVIEVALNWAGTLQRKP